MGWLAAAVGAAPRAAYAVAVGSPRVRGYAACPRAAAEQQRALGEAFVSWSTDGDLTAQHARDFLDCMRSRERPNADVEIGHRSTTFSLLANVALATRSRLEWDPKTERTDNPEANKLLSYEYRKPWVLR